MKRTPRKERKSSDLSKLSKVSFADDVREYILQETQEAFRPHPLSSASLDHSSDSGGNMRIFVSTPAGESIALVAEPFFTIDYLKMKIQEKVGVSSHRQRLVLPTGDRLLDLGEGGRNLSDYKIKNESTIRLLLKDPEPITPAVTLDEEPLALDNLSDLFVDHVVTSEKNNIVPEDGAIMPNSYLNIPGNQDDNDNISVLTCATSYTSFSAVSGNNSELCLPDILQDDTSILTPRTTNYSIKHPRPREHPRRRQPLEGAAAAAIQRRWRWRRSNLVNRSPSLLETRPGGNEDQAGPLVASNDHQEPLVSKEETAEEQPTKNRNSQASNIPSLATTTTQNDEQLYLPPPVPLLPVSNIEEETLYTAVAEARVSVDCGSTLNTNERSLFIKQGRCPTCGIQTHRKSGMFKKRSLRPLSNEHVLMGRCLICNPINIVTREITGANESPFSAEEEANNQATADEHFDGGGQHDSLSAHMDTQVSGRETKAEESPNNVAHLFDHSRTPLSVPSLFTPNTEDHQPKRKDSTPSAPSLNDVCSEPDIGDLQQKLYDERETHSSSKAGPRGEVERWLLSHLPALKKQDLVKYCRCLDDDGFDSTLMLDVLEEGDLSFMKKAHRRVLTKRLRSRPCVDP